MQEELNNFSINLYYKYKNVSSFFPNGEKDEDDELILTACILMCKKLFELRSITERFNFKTDNYTSKQIAEMEFRILKECLYLHISRKNTCTQISSGLTT